MAELVEAIGRRSSVLRSTTAYSGAWLIELAGRFGQGIKLVDGRDQLGWHYVTQCRKVEQ